MANDRDSIFHGNQIKDRTVTKAELDATSESTGKVLTVQSNGSVDWEFIQTLADYVKLQDNMMLNAFRIAINGSLTQFNMIDGIVDEYEDESGIDTVNSINESYDATNDFYKPTTDADTKLLLHLNGSDGATSTTDDSPSSHTITFGGTAQLDTAFKKFGTASLLLDGNSDYLTAPASTDWDICASNSDDWTIDFQIRFTNHTGSEYILYDWQDAQEYWFFRHLDTVGFNFKLHTATGVTLIDTGFGGEITDTNWHHVALIKKASEYGVYVDGTQVSYVNDSSTNSLNGQLSIGREGQFGGVNYFDGHLDEIRITHSNAFSASPNVGKTDTITVPTSEYTSGIEDMTLISDSFTAEAEPDTARIVLLEEDVDAVTLNTDLKAYASRDGGSSWVQGTLSDEGDYDASKRILVADFDLTQSGVGSGTSMEYKLETANKEMKIHASSLNWD